MATRLMTSMGTIAPSPACFHAIQRRAPLWSEVKGCCVDRRKKGRHRRSVRGACWRRKEVKVYQICSYGVLDNDDDDYSVGEAA